MRKLKLFLSMLMLIAFSVGNVWATDVTYSLTPDATSTGSSATSYQASLSFTYEGVSWTMAQINPSTLQTKTNQSSATAEFNFHNTSAFPGRITKVVVTYSALTVATGKASEFKFLGGTSEVTATTGGDAATWNSTNKTMTWTPAANTNYTYFAYYMNGKTATGSNYLAESDAIVVTYETSGGGKTLTSIAVSGAPTKTAYYVGDEFDPAGLVVTGTYSDDSQAAITSGITWAYDPSQELALNQTSIGVTATVNEISSPKVNVSITVTEAPAAVNYEKVTSEPADWSGEYILVYEADASNARVWKGADQANNYAEATISNGVIAAPEDAAVLNIAKVAESDPVVYTIMLGDKYIGQTSNSNGIKIQDDAINNSISYNGTDAAVDIVASSAHLRYNSASSSYFRYYKSSSYSSQKKIQLYKKAGAPAAVAKPTISGTDNFLTSTEVTIECTTDGAAIYYTTTESAKATPATSGDWAAYNGASKPSFSATTTVWAAAKLGDDWSAVAEQTFTKATVMTVAQALEAAAGADKYVKGIISSIDEVSTEHGNATYYLKDEGQENSIKIYRGKYLDNASFTAADQIYEGDEVTVFGTISVYSEVNQFAQGNYIVALKPAARLAWAGTTEGAYNAEIGGTNTFPTLTNTNDVAVTYSSSNTDYATISNEEGHEGEITLVAEGSTTITASFAGNETYKAKSVSYTLNVASSVIRADISFEENGGSTVTDLTEQSNLPDPLPTITKAGYNFGGWWTTSDFQAGTEAVAGAAVESTDDIVLYAKWLDPYPVAQALDMAATNGVYVKGIISSIEEVSTEHGNATYNLKDEGQTNSIKIYRGKYLDNASFTAASQIAEDDEVVVYGNLVDYKGTMQLAQGNYLISLVRKADPELAWSETSFDAYIGESNTFPTLTNDHNVAVTYSSTETDYATISNEEGHEGEITLVAVGTTTIKATFAGDEDYKAAEVSYTLNVYNPITAGTITYEENGGSEVADVETPVENLPDPLPTPTKENNIFAGWWTTSTFDAGTQAVAGAPMSGNIILYAKWIQIPPYALVYTSNVDFVGAGSYKEDGSKVIISETEYAAQKVGSSSNTGEVVVTVPAKTHTLHFHVFTWKNQSNVTSISGVNNIKVNGVSGTTISVNGDNAGGGSKTYTIESDPVSHYQYITFDAVDVPTDITFAYSSGDKRIIMYGINQEGGVLPVLDHIVITGDATELEYEVGDEFNPAGLGVNAIYTLESVEQDPVAVDAADIEWSFNPAHIAANTESVTVTATVGGKSANKTVENIVVNIPNPEILVDPASVAFGTVNQDATVDAEVINVTLKTVANATISLTGDVAAFTLDKTALTENGTISVTPVTSVAGTFAATITISDDATAADSKEVTLTMTVKAPEVPDVCDGTDDFDTDETSSGGDYKDRFTTNGWTAVYTCRKTIDEHTYWTINGKTTNVGIITSPVLSDGIGSLKFRYANTFSESNGVSVKIEIKQNGSVVKEYTLTKANSEVTQNEVYTELIEDINVAGDFQIVFTNLCPSNKNNSNKDRVSIGRLCWTGYTAPEPPVVDYTEVRNDLTEGWYYTMCLDRAVTAVKAGSIWKVLSKAANGNDVILEEVTGTLDAGRPYIFRAAASTLEVAYTGDAVGAPVTEGNNGLVGSFTEEPLAQNPNHYIIYNNALYYVNSDNVKVGAHRAYLNMTGVPAYSNEPQQGAPRRRVTMAVYGEQTATGMDALNATDAPVKMMINGQLFILRGEKMYDATGRLVK